MLAAEKKTGTTMIIGGIAIQIAANVIAGIVNMGILGTIGALVGAVVFILGCVNIAKAKGQPPVYGLLGLLSCVGLAVLWFVIEDKNKTA